MGFHFFKVFLAPNTLVPASNCIFVLGYKVNDRHVHTKKPENAKKHSVVIIVRANCEKKWFSCNLKFFPSYLGWKKGISKTFRSLGFASTSKTFFLMPFFQPWFLGKNFKLHLNNFFSQFARTIMTTKYYWISRQIFCKSLENR